MRLACGGVLGGGIRSGPAHTTLAATHPATHLPQHAAKALLEAHELGQPLLQRGGELEQPQRVARGRGVKDDAGVVHRLDLQQGRQVRKKERK